MSLVSLAQVRSAYVRFARRYYSGYDMPSVDEVDFEWIEHPTNLGLTIFLDRSVQTREVLIQLHPVMRGFPRLLWMILLHEMSHVANPKADHGPWWKREAVRLGTLGAMREFF